MRELAKLGLCLWIGAISLAGCGKDPSEVQLDTLRQSREPLKNAAIAVHGDWSKLTEDRKALFLKEAHNDESAAKGLCQMMGNHSKIN